MIEKKNPTLFTPKTKDWKADLVAERSQSSSFLFNMRVRSEIRRKREKKEEEEEEEQEGEEEEEHSDATIVFSSSYFSNILSRWFSMQKRVRLCFLAKQSNIR